MPLAHVHTPCFAPTPRTYYTGSFFFLLLLISVTWSHILHIGGVLLAKSCLTLATLTLEPTRFRCPWDFPGKNTGVGCHFLLQGIFPTQELNPSLLHNRRILYQLSYKGSPLYITGVDLSSSSNTHILGIFWPSSLICSLHLPNSYLHSGNHQFILSIYGLVFKSHFIVTSGRISFFVMAELFFIVQLTPEQCRGWGHCKPSIWLKISYNF